mmetsp:Transcript_13963/g.48465  ORF Transcript_13963/g.48465 Transcript_13963/m.48465 type:complete len:99 (+) Transcript_13963:937-1233(+)
MPTRPSSGTSRADFSGRRRGRRRLLVFPAEARAPAAGAALQRPFDRRGRPLDSATNTNSRSAAACGAVSKLDVARIADAKGCAEDRRPRTRNDGDAQM